jgi:hypothetical protein
MNEEEKEAARRRVHGPLRLLLAVKRYECEVMKLSLDMGEGVITAEEGYNRLVDARHAFRDEEDKAYGAVLHTLHGMDNPNPTTTTYEFENWVSRVSTCRQHRIRKEREAASG